jgi:hypothetical protein
LEAGVSLWQLLRRGRRGAEPQQETPPAVDGRASLARRIAAQYAIAESSPLAYYAETGELPGELPGDGPGLLQQEIEWARAWPWIEAEHLRDLTWLSNYLDDPTSG